MTSNPPAQIGTATHQEMRIPLRILLIVMSHLQCGADMLGLLLTCRAMFDYGARYLRCCRVYISDSEPMAPLPFGSSSDDPSCLAFVRNLSIDISHDGYNGTHSDKLNETGAMLKSILDYDRLSSLSMSFSMPSNVTKSFNVHARLTSLRTLRLSNARTFDCFVLQCVPSPLVELSIHFDENSFAHEGDSFTFPDLARFASTLEVFECVGLAGRFRLPSLPCKKVHTLVLGKTHRIPFHRLVASFPGVKSLTFTLSRDAIIRKPCFAMRKHLASLNSVARTDVPRRWYILRRVTTDRQSLLSLGLVPQIRRLDLHIGATKHLLDINFLRHLHACLNRCEPAALELTMICDISALCLWLRLILSLPRSYLVLSDVIINAIVPNQRYTRTLLLKLIPVLGKIFPHVEYLVLRVQWKSNARSSCAGTVAITHSEDSNDPSAIPKQSINALDTLDIVHKAMQTFPMIRYAFVETQGMPRSSWDLKVSDSGSGRTVAEIPDQTAKNILCTRSLM